MLRKITALILAVTMLIPTNIYADANYDYHYENPSEDPNIYIDEYGNSYVISDMEVYYEHEHWNVKGAMKFNSDYAYYATTEHDGVIRMECNLCKNSHIPNSINSKYYRIPRIKTVKNRNTKYTWEEIAMTLIDYNNPGNNFSAVAKLLGKKTYFIDSEGKKIEPYSYQTQEMANNTYARKYKKTYRYQTDKSDFLIGKINYYLSDENHFYEPIECSYTVTPPNCYIMSLDPYKNSVQFAGDAYTKNKKYGKNLKKYDDLYDYAILIDDSEIQYSTNKTFKKNTKTVLGSAISKNKYIIKKLKTNTTYYFRYRLFKVVDGVKYYSSWSPVRSIKTLNGKKKNMYYKRKDFKNPGYEIRL